MAWESYRAIIDESREIARSQATARPLACPNDGEPLVANARGQLQCPFDGWEPNGLA